MDLVKYIKYKKFLFLLPLLLLFTSCLKEPVVDDQVFTTVPDDSETQIRDFVWSAMNSWYLYQGEVENLRDTKDDNISDYVAFLRSFGSPEALFDALIFKPNIKDRFSFIVDDYKELENQLQGISESFGYDYRLARTSPNGNEVIGYVRYVLPGSPAYVAGIRRGDLFGEINGTQLTTTNYQNLLFQKKSYELGLVEYKNEKFVIDHTVHLEAEIIHENPVFETEVLEAETGAKVGYLVLNGFNHLYHHELNQAFATFKAQNVKELVLDLRYNPGGSVITAATLASMIYTDDTEKRFIKFDYNEKHNDLDQPMNFLDKVYIFNTDYDVTGIEPLNSLGLSRVFVLTSSGTASASEAVINGLKPYINVVVIGERTVGKNVGSRTLYDSPASDYMERSTANPIHTYALQPLTTKIVNSVGFGDFEDGFEPDIEISEFDYLIDLKPLGSIEEPLLHAALQYLSPTRSAMRIPTNFDGSSLIPGPERKSENPFYRSLILDQMEMIR